MEESSGDPCLDEIRRLVLEHGEETLFPPLDGTAFFLLICRINHSCEPNVAVRYSCLPHEAASAPSEQRHLLHPQDVLEGLFPPSLLCSFGLNIITFPLLAIRSGWRGGCKVRTGGERDEKKRRADSGDESAAGSVAWRGAAAVVCGRDPDLRGQTESAARVRLCLLLSAVSAERMNIHQCIEDV